MGRAVLSDRVNGIGAGELWVGIDPDADYADTVAEVRAVTAAYDGALAEVRSYFSGRLDDGGALISETDPARRAARRRGGRAGLRRGARHARRAGRGDREAPVAA